MEFTLQSSWLLSVSSVVADPCSCESKAKPVAVSLILLASCRGRFEEGELRAGRAF